MKEVAVNKTRLPISQVTPGMKLAEPIMNAAGITLMPAGIRLTPMFIARIRKWRIDALDIIVDAARGEITDENFPRTRSSGKTTVVISRKRHDRPAGDDVPLPESREQFARAVAAEISRTFVNVRNSPLMMQLRAAVIKRLVRDGPDSAVNVLRRGPRDQLPLPLDPVLPVEDLLPAREEN